MKRQATHVGVAARSVRYSSVARYRGTTVLPRHRGTIFHGTSTVVFTVLFSTAIPQVPRFFDTVLVRY